MDFFSDQVFDRKLNQSKNDLQVNQKNERKSYFFIVSVQEGSD